MPLSDRHAEALDRYREQCEVEERAQDRMICAACGAVDGMQPYTRSLIGKGRTKFYVRDDDPPEDDTAYAPCQVCGVAYERGVPAEYRVWRG